jgi:hypothetical protein
MDREHERNDFSTEFNVQRAVRNAIIAFLLKGIRE